MTHRERFHQQRVQTRHPLTEPSVDGREAIADKYKVTALLSRLAGQRLEHVFASRYGIGVPHFYLKVEDRRWLAFDYDTSESVVGEIIAPCCNLCDEIVDLSPVLAPIIGQRILEVRWFDASYLGLRLIMERGMIDFGHDPDALWNWNIHFWSAAGERRPLSTLFADVGCKLDGRDDDSDALFHFSDPCLFWTA